MSTAELSLVSQSFGYRNVKRRARGIEPRVGAAPVVKAKRTAFLLRLSDWLMHSRIDWVTGGRELPSV